MPNPALQVVAPAIYPLLHAASERNQAQAAFFAQQLEFQARLKGLAATDAWGNFHPWFPITAGLPAFPSYALPQISNTQIEITKPGSVPHIFGGLAGNPALSHLVTPSAGRAAGSVASAMNTEPSTPRVEFSAVIKEANPKAAVSAEAEKAATGLAPAYRTSSLLGSVPVKKVESPSVSFQYGDAKKK